MAVAQVEYEPDDPTAIGRILAEDWERFALAVRAESELSRRRFIVDWPALTRWRDRVLRDRRRYTPDIVAAALESLALECHLAGHPELAARAIAEAESIVLGACRSAVDARVG